MGTITSRKDWPPSAEHGATGSEISERWMQKSRAVRRAMNLNAEPAPPALQHDYERWRLCRPGEAVDML